MATLQVTTQPKHAVTPYHIRTTMVSELPEPLQSREEMRQRREAIGLSQTELAEMLVLGREAVNRIETGRMPMQYRVAWHAALVFYVLETEPAQRNPVGRPANAPVPAPVSIEEMALLDGTPITLSQFFAFPITKQFKRRPHSLAPWSLCEVGENQRIIEIGILNEDNTLR